MDTGKIKHLVERNRLPNNFPTQMHDAVFWEGLGRVIATFGFLEEVLAKAIFAFTATKKYNETDIEHAYDEWLPKLERALSDPLGSLIDTYGKAVRENPESTVEDLEGLLELLRKASKIRNVLCHASWRAPDTNGASIPFFVNKEQEIFDTPIGLLFFDQVQRHVVDLVCDVIDTVTQMGFQFPGSKGPGGVIWSKGTSASP